MVDIDEARRQLTLTADDDSTQRITLLTDAVSTQYNGFGGMVNDTPEVFRGSRGFTQVSVGDRIDIRGTGRGTARVSADQITLLGRSNVSSSGSSSSSANVAEGTIRQINLREGRLVIQTDRRMITVRTTSTTPVYYRGQSYQVANLEVGDRIRIDYEPRTAAADEITARSIDVTQSVDEGGTVSGDRVTNVTGRVTRIDRGADTIRVNTGRSDVTIDVARAGDSSGRRMRASDFKVDDQVDITGSYSSASNIFVASTVRMNDDVLGTPRSDSDDSDDRDPAEFVMVTISGTVSESLQTSPTLVVKERTTNRTLHVFATDDFIYRTKAGTYATADRLANGDLVLIKAFRDEDGNLIAQTIRIR
ncbi:MAG: hypothetical protein JJE51_00285 [Thermoanaerobaculia bacterium]|nr:hypothetical protein [Thermoanaerobaculia bacterium]